MERRSFIQGVTAAGVLTSLGLHALPSEPGKGGLPYRALGRTGEKVSVIGIGGAHIGRGPSEQEAIQLIRSGIDRGILWTIPGTTTMATAKSAWARH